MRFPMLRKLLWLLLGFHLVIATATADTANASKAGPTPESGPKIIKTLAAGIPHAAFFGVAFDAGKGVAVGAGGVIFESADAGQTWAPVKQGLTELAFLAVDRRGTHTIAVGQAGLVAIEEQPGKWVKVDMDAPTRLFSVSVNTSGLAVAVGEFGAVFKSADGGRTWASSPPDWASYADAATFGTGEPNLYAVDVNEQGVITLAGEFGVILRSSNAGASWSVLRPVKADAPTVFALYIPRQGQGSSFAVGQRGELLVSADGGKVWQRHTPVTQSNFLGVTVAGNEVVITGMRVMLRSQDGGNQWTPIEEGDTTTDWYQGVRTEASSGRVVAVGHSGRIIQIGG